MSKRVFKLIGLLLVVAVVSYLFYLNPQSVSVNYRSDSIWTAPLALILVVTFFSGVLITSFVGIAIGLSHSFRNWQLSKKYKSKDSHYQKIVQARSLLASGNYQGATQELKKIISQDPADTIARIELAKAFHAQGSLEDALKTLDQARLEDKHNAEMLFLSSELHEQTLNFTAAYDAVQLILQQEPTNEKALSQIVFYATELKRFSEAIEFQKRRIRQASHTIMQSLQSQLATLELALATQQSPNSESTLKEVEGLLKRHRDFVPALEFLANFERNRSNLPESVKFYSKAYQYSGDTKFITEIAKTWLRVDDPKKALGAVRTAITDRAHKEGDDISGRLCLVWLMLHLEMTEEASKELEIVESLSRTDSDVLKQSVQFVKASLLKKKGQLEESSSIFQSLTLEYIPLSLPELFDLSDEDSTWSAKARQVLAKQSPLSPSLSTP